MPSNWAASRPAVTLPAERGAGGGYSVLGFWRPADPLMTGAQPFMGIRAPTAFTAELFVFARANFLTGLTPTDGARAGQRLDSQSLISQGAARAMGPQGPDPVLFATLFPRTQSH